MPEADGEEGTSEGGCWSEDTKARLLKVEFYCKNNGTPSECFSKSALARLIFENDHIQYNFVDTWR